MKDEEKNAQTVTLRTGYEIYYCRKKISFWEDDLGK